jgi:hypothetical protein
MNIIIRMRFLKMAYNDRPALRWARIEGTNLTFRTKNNE